MVSIPASEIVSVTPSVLSAGGTGLDLNGLILTTNTRIPIGTVANFATAADVSSYFGGSSAEATAAGIYFNGFEGSSKKPGNLLMAQYNTTAVAAFLRGASVASLTLAQLQAINGTLSIDMDGYAWPDATINLSSATSFSNAASLMQTALQATAPTTASVTATTVSSSTSITITAVGSGTPAPGQTITGTNIPANTTIVSQTSGTTGSTGVYVMSNAASGSGSGITVTAKATVFTVAYDSVSGAFVFTSGITGVISTAPFATGATSATLKLTSATGAVISQGAAFAVPATFMAAVIVQTQNWAAFDTLFDPDGGSGNTNKLAFAVWTNSTNKRYAYICWDTDASPTTNNPATSSLGYLINQANYAGTTVIYEPSDQSIHHFILGAIASINFDQLNGRITFAFRRQDGLTAGVTNATVASNLRANGYSFYGSYATAADQFTWFYPGSVSGDYDWLDTYVDEIWLTNAFQLALMELLQNTYSIPYNQQGYTLIEAACNDPIIAAVNFGAIRAGIPLSSAQIVEVNQAAGVEIAPTLQTRGWYLQILSATPQVRAARGSPPMSFWYMDGGSVQSLSLQSVVLQ